MVNLLFEENRRGLKDIVGEHVQLAVARPIEGTKDLAGENSSQALTAQNPHIPHFPNSITKD
jgi:hypothetical protein